MKKMIFTIAIIFINTAYAENYNACNGEFTNAIQSYQLGRASFDTGMSEYKEAVEEANQRAPRLAVVCQLLLSSLVKFDRGSDEYGRSADVFTAAINSCAGEDRQRAMTNRGIVSKNATISMNNHNQIKSSYEKICHRGAELAGLPEFLQLSLFIMAL